MNHMVADAKMPVLFVGHGSPMNALAENQYTKRLNDLGTILPIPKAILVISAHWMTEGTWLTAMKYPPTIHDFSGFPEELYNVNYPAPGDPDLVERIINNCAPIPFLKDFSHWGFIVTGKQIGRAHV